MKITESTSTLIASNEYLCDHQAFTDTKFINAFVSRQLKLGTLFLQNYNFHL